MRRDLNFAYVRNITASLYMSNEVWLVIEKYRFNGADTRIEACRPSKVVVVKRPVLPQV